MRIFLLMASLLPILWGLIGVEIDALDCQSISLSQIEWVASINEDVNPDTPNNHAEVVEGSDTYGDYYGMCWNSPMFTDLSLNGIDQFDREDIRSVSLTLSASEEMEVAVVVRVAVADCGEGWRYAIADERLHVTTVSQEFTVPYSEFSDNPFGSCSGPLSEHALEGIDSIVLLPSSRKGEIRVYRVSLCNSDYLASSNRTIPSSEDATGSATSALDWQMILTEPGVTRYVLRCQFPEDSQELVGLQLAQLDASGREGIEFLIDADPSTPIRVWIVWAKEDSGGGEETLEWRSAVDPIQAGPEAHVFRLAFEQFCLQEDYTTANGCGVKINAIRGIYFEPLSTNVELEISYLALYSSLGTMIFTQVIDQYSLWSVEKPGEWVVGSRASIEFAGKPIMETLLTTEAWRPGGVLQVGGTLEVVPDPTGSGRDLVCRVTIPPLVRDGKTLASSGPRIQRYYGSIGEFIYRIYGAAWFPHYNPPCIISIDVYLDTELVSTAAQATSGTILLDVFDRCLDPSASGCWEDRYGDAIDSSLQAKLWLGSNIDGETYLSLKYGDDAYAVAPLAEGAPPFTPNEWHTISIAIYPDRTACLYQDGRLVACHALNPNRAGGTTGGHPGLYIHDSISRGEYAVRGVFLYDNYRIQCNKDLDIEAIITQQAK